MKGYQRYCIILAISLLPLFIFAQNIKRFRHIDVNMGLAHTDATAVAEDETGFIWIGTNSGLQRYDGRQLKLFFNSQHKLNQVYNNRITALFPDRDILWVGSEGGLHAFRLTEEVYIPLKYTGINFATDPRVISEISMIDNNLWFIASNKLYVGSFNPSTSSLETIEPGKVVDKFPEWASDCTYYSLATDRSGTIWAGTSRGLLILQRNGSTFQAVTFSSSGEIPGINEYPVSIIEYSHKQLWLISNNILQVLSLSGPDQQPRSIVKTISLKEVFKGTLFEKEPLVVNDILIGNNADFWCGTATGLIHIENPVSENPVPRLFTHSQYDPFSLTANNISGLHLDHSNCLWISTWSGGLSYTDLEQKQFQLLVKDPSRSNYSLSESFVRAITQDGSGHIWIGGQNEGLDEYTPATGICRPFQMGRFSNSSFENRKVRALKYTEKKLLMGTTTGINVIDFKSGQIMQFNNLFNLVNNPVYTIEVDRNGYIWAGTWRGGILRFKISNNQLTDTLLLNASPGRRFRLSSNQVNFLLYDHTKNELLAGTNYGLNRIILDESGNIRDVVYYRGNNSETSLSSEYVWPIVKQNDTVYWLGTLGGGLNKVILLPGWNENRMGNYKAVSYPVEAGAPSNDIESLLSDEQGRLWIGSKGLSVFDPNTEEFWNFDINDGLQSNGFKIGSAFRSDDHTLYFGGINGLNYFKPQEIRRNSFQPKVVLTGLQIRNQEVKPGQMVNKRILLPQGIHLISGLKLTHRENDFSVSFASLHYANPRKCTYKFRLNGYETAWHYISGEYPVAGYSNLQYGDYLFEVDATNGDGIWSNQLIKLPIHISPPWWLSYPAYLTYLVLMGILGYLVYFYTSKWIRMRKNLKLAEAEEARKEEIHQVKLQFFTNISHEFKTPLTLIMTPAEKLINEKNPPEEQRRLLSVIYNNANRLFLLVNELLDFRKVETGKMHLQAQVMDFSRFASNIIQQFEPQAFQKQISLTYPPAKEIQVWFDPELMTKILFNLLSNAIRYTDQGGHIDVGIFTGTQKEVISHYPDKYEIRTDVTTGEFCFIRVLDTGVGISSGSLSQIFERFFQGDKPVGRHLGTGVGLALLKSLVELHRGYILVSSERFKGTEFILGFPLGNAHLNPEEKIMGAADIGRFRETGSPYEVSILQEDTDETSQRKNLPSLLIVEDNEELRKMLAEHFALRYEVLEAEDGGKGYEQALDHLPDIILSDVMMPVKDGFELCRLIKENMRTSHIPVVLLTAKSSVESQIEGTEAGADEYIAKPFSLKLLDAKIDRMLENYRKIKEKFGSDVLSSSREVARNQKDRDFMESLTGFLDNNLDNSDLSVDEICQEVGLGRTNLYKKMKSLTDQSLGEFIRTYRLKKAASILLEEDVSVSEVIYRVGINSHSYFTKAFKMQFKYTPSEFIKRTQKPVKKNGSKPFHNE